MPTYLYGLTVFAVLALVGVRMPWEARRHLSKSGQANPSRVFVFGVFLGRDYFDEIGWRKSVVGASLVLIGFIIFMATFLASDHP